jgi:hypothetical protein
MMDSTWTMKKGQKANDDNLQRLVRSYLKRLSHMASKHHLLPWLKDVIRQNKKGECKATRHEANLLARIVDDESVLRKDIPKLIGKSYRHCVENNIFGSITKLKPKGNYSKIDVMMLKEEENG